jgi:transposase-like protein
MNCKRCAGAEVVRSGKRKDKQIYKCKGCGYKFVEGDKRKERFIKEKKQALGLYLEGLGFNAIGRRLGVSDVSVLRWIRKAGKAMKKHHEKVKEEIKKKERK